MTVDKPQQWASKYPPKTFEEMILHPDIRSEFKDVMRVQPNLIIHGNHGIGKVTFASVFINEMDFTNMWVNCADITSKTYVRDRIKPFAVSMNPHLKYKVLVLKKAESLSKPIKDDLSQIMDMTEKITRYIFTFNNEKKITDSFKSRCEVIEIKDPPIDDIIDRLKIIMDNENIQYDGDALFDHAQKYYPDIRKIINKAQLNFTASN